MNVATKKKDGPDNLYLLNNRYKNAHVANKTAWTHHSTAGPFKHFTSVDFNPDDKHRQGHPIRYHAALPIYYRSLSS